MNRAVARLSALLVTGGCVSAACGGKVVVDDSRMVRFLGNETVDLRAQVGIFEMVFEMANALDDEPLRGWKDHVEGVADMGRKHIPAEPVSRNAVVEWKPD